MSWTFASARAGKISQVTARRYVAPADRRPRRRGDIPALDGIRAVAVALVLADHGGIPGLSGGFLGVDVFFVLSGFLITSLLLDELGRTGRIALRGFWIRRARRLLPAVIVMVLAVVAARDLFPPEAIAALRDDAVAAFFWIANWAFVAQKTDYFSQGAAPSPLQHTWSLGVEEQYYLIWPLLLIAVAAVFRGRARLAVFVLATAGVLASAAAAILFTSEATLNRIYFGTDTRAQALLVGAAAAALLVRDWSTLTIGGTPIRTRWSRWVARILPVIGLAVLAAAAHYATGAASEFRGGLLIIVAMAAVLVVAPVALEQGGPVARVLAWRPLVWLGAISYGVYLWHWPIFLALNGERTGWSGWSLFALRCAATIAVAAASWWLLEQPVRRWRPVMVPLLPLAGATAATAAAVTMLVLPVGTKPGDGLPTSDIDSAALVLPEVPVEVTSPSGQRPVGTRTVAVFGDSIAWTLMRYLPPTPGLSFTDYTTIGCGVARGGPYRYFGATLNQKPECDAWPSRWSQRIQPRPARCGAVDRRALGDRRSDARGPLDSHRRPRPMTPICAASSAAPWTSSARPAPASSSRPSPTTGVVRNRTEACIPKTIRIASTTGTPCCAASSANDRTSRCSTSTRSWARTGPTPPRSTASACAATGCIPPPRRSSG